MVASAGPHKCRSCSHTFTTKGSLHRHEQNHSPTTSFTCSICDVSFRRRDLLMRHAGVHGNNKEGSSERQRARKACDGCRQARTKCSGGSRCTRCSNKSVPCLYTAGSARTSVDNAYKVHNSDHPEEDNLSMLDHADITNISANLQAEEIMLDLNQASDRRTDDLSMCVPSLSNDDYSTPTTIAWPWLHENLFLRDDLNLDWFSPPTAAQDEAMVLQGPHNRVTGTGNQLSMGPNRSSSEIRSSDMQAQEDSVIELVTTAVDFTPYQSSSANSAVSTFYIRLPEMVQTVIAAFEIEGTNAADFHTYLDLYLTNFWPLWPLSPRQHFFDHLFEPILYLAMVSIGAMYGDRRSSTFGVSLHNKLRDELIRPALEIDLPEVLMLPLGQARSLTQAAALYFGHQRAFSYAAHLGSSLVVQARKMNLFTTPHARPCHGQDTVRRVKSWVSRESRIRLAFAILRLEMYTSALFMTRPLVSGHEMNVTLPCSKLVWTTSFTTLGAFAAAIEQDTSATSHMLNYSDLLNVLIDAGEELPYLDILHGELLTNALQEEVWTASTSKSRYQRLVPQSAMIFDCGLKKAAAGPSDSALNNAEFRLSLDAHLTAWVNMKSLVDQIHRTTSALRKLRDHVLRLYRSYAARMDTSDRSSLFSCLLAYHLYFLQLHAPMAMIQNLYHRADQRHDPDKQPELNTWASSEAGTVSAQHAIRIYHLLHAETAKPKDERAKVNFFAMLGLYHSATVLYAFDNFKTTSSDSPQHPATDDFVTIFRELNPAWAARSSFSNMLLTLR